MGMGILDKFDDPRKKEMKERQITQLITFENMLNDTLSEHFQNTFITVSLCLTLRLTINEKRYKFKETLNTHQKRTDTGQTNTPCCIRDPCPVHGSLAGGGETVELLVLVDGLAQTVDAGVVADALVGGVHHDDFEVFVGRVLSWGWSK